jgi:hypothetical protein
LDDAQPLLDYNIQNEFDRHILTGTYLLSKQNFVNTLIAFLRTVHSFLSSTLDEHWRKGLIIMLPNV